MKGLILIIGDMSHSTALVELLLSKIDLPVLVVGNQPKKEDVYTLVPNRIDFDIDKPQHVKPYSQNSYKSVKERNAFYRKRRY